MTQQYPRTPGWKEEAVSKANVRGPGLRARKLKTLKAQVLALFEGGFVGSSDDVAARLGISPFAIRPRCSELVAEGKVVKTTIRRKANEPSRWLLKIAPDEPADDGQPDEMQEWHDYDPEC